ncbi:MAG: hypothetical protein NTX79_04785 [Candidatus Micrarchaeota archaeon]|nr:hypothetical protein [Candidatus Micrarchaeota archaeon]
MGRQNREEILESIWQPPRQWKTPGAWLWWFWLFFIHDENTKKTGKCRQLMILWSIKKDNEIMCNSLDIRQPRQLEARADGTYCLNGAAAAWYFDGEQMHEDIVLEASHMSLDPRRRSLSAPGRSPSSFFMRGSDFVTRIKSGEHEFEFVARQKDLHPAVGPTHGATSLPAGMLIEGTRIETLELSGTEAHNGKKCALSGTAYFQKILLAAPPPQWYWGLYHFFDGSFFTYMVPYSGRAMLADNAWKGARLKTPSLPLKQDIFLYHAPSRRVFEGSQLTVAPSRIGKTENYLHELTGGGNDFGITATARAYSHACWSFRKKIGSLPARSNFRYNEYPAVLESLELTTRDGEVITLKNGWGNMENSWGFII